MSVRPWYVASWLAVAATATAVGVGTVALVRSTVGTDAVVTSLSQADVRAELSAAARVPSAAPTSPAPAASPSSRASGPAVGTHTSPSAGARPSGLVGASRSPHPSAAATGTATPRSTSDTRPSPTDAASLTGVLSSAGGTVVARCTAGSVYLVSWSPAQGFGVDEVHRGGPGAREAGITFVQPGQELQVHVSCGPDGPVQQVETDLGSPGPGDY